MGPSSDQGSTAPSRLTSTLAIAAVFAATIWMLPVTYQNNDDPQYQQVFDGNDFLGIVVFARQTP